MQRPKPAVVVVELAKGSVAHSYSIQTMNSTEQARELLRKEMAKVSTVSDPDSYINQYTVLQ